MTQAPPPAPAPAKKPAAKKPAAKKPAAKKPSASKMAQQKHGLTDEQVASLPKTSGEDTSVVFHESESPAIDYAEEQARKRAEALDAKDARLKNARKAQETLIQDDVWYEVSLSNEYTVYRACRMTGSGGSVSRGVTVEVIQREGGLVVDVKFMKGATITPNPEDGGETVILSNIFAGMA